MGSPDIKIDDVMWALGRLGLKEYIKSLPQGLDTTITPESPQIPYSIRKKLIMTRCLAKHPKILLVDDFFSVWMPDQRKDVCDFLTCEDLDTVIAVSGEKNYAINCDRIIVMEKVGLRRSRTPTEIIIHPS